MSIWKKMFPLREYVEDPKHPSNPNDTAAYVYNHELAMAKRFGVKNPEQRAASKTVEFAIRYGRGKFPRGNGGLDASKLQDAADVAGIDLSDYFDV